ncbi:uncharacterized protein LOC117145666 [Drosophila mauritiana]|uniref:Uncharacterized protein LOC117145666 n=1 Tax=Drosophila mauritiana TaxID=7226 RepID=A0A6P8KIE9_DROMA|nr:uncharacterized protein LOC117145666 [Drosophila mauritiana]
MYRSKLQNVGYLSQVCLLLSTLIRPIPGLLLFPTSTVLQLTSSISIPADLNTRTKVFMDMGFQMNYNLPPTVSAFYNATIWADELSRRQKRQLDNSLVANLQQWDLEGGMHPGDFTAGQLYKGIENMLETYGFHRSCLLRSVCELALHPFAEDHFYGMVTQVITFLLTPSQHEGFAEDEQHYRDRYEEAEQIGFLGGQCHLSYPSCQADIINLATRLVR